MRNNVQKAFTLVELIVVITILAILGTIAFLSLQGYSADARNSKRSSDSSNIQSAIVTAQTKGSNLMSFITSVPAKQMTGSTANAAIVGGTGTISGTDYVAGTPNYTSLGLKAADFKDPGGQDYLIGATSKVNGKFEIVSSMENGVIRTAAVSGNYIPRTTVLGTNKTTTASYTVSVLSGATSLTLADADINKFFIGDTVNNGSGTTKKIISISSDLKTLTFDGAMNATGTTLFLGTGITAVDEMAGLTAMTGGVASTIITNGSTTNLPY